MRINLALFGAVGLALCSSGCIYTDRSEDYLKSGSVPSVVLPEGVNSTPLEPLYPIPEVPQHMDAFMQTDIGGDRVPRPEPMSAEREAAKVKIQKVGERKWVLIEAPASQVWPLAQSYLSETGIEVAKSDAASGLIETDWVQFKADTSTESHYRIRIEKGVRPESTEVHVLQQQRASSSNAFAPWPASSNDPAREDWLLEGMANSLAQGVNNKSASLLGQSVGGDSKAELAVDNGEPVIVLRLDKERAWATLAYGLQKENFIRWEENDQTGVFYFQYTGDYKKPNWFKRMLFLGDKKPTTEQPVALNEALGHIANTPDTRKLLADSPSVNFAEPLSAEGYMLVVKQAGQGYVVHVRDYKGERLEPELNKRILVSLRRNLI